MEERVQRQQDATTRLVPDAAPDWPFGLRAVFRNLLLRALLGTVEHLGLNQLSAPFVS